MSYLLYFLLQLSFPFIMLVVAFVAGRGYERTKLFERQATTPPPQQPPQLETNVPQAPRTGGGYGGRGAAPARPTVHAGTCGIDAQGVLWTICSAYTFLPLAQFLVSYVYERRVSLSGGVEKDQLYAYIRSLSFVPPNSKGSEYSLRDLEDELRTLHDMGILFEKYVSQGIYYRIDPVSITPIPHSKKHPSNTQ